MKTLNELFREIILANELSNNLKFALRFSDPDGVRSGKSGWSFGVCQYDTQNNDSALACLRECSFTEAEIDGIVRQNIDVKPLAAKLAAHADIVAKWDERQLSHCLNDALNFCTARGVPLQDSEAILAVADVINQYGSVGDGFERFMDALARPITAKDVLAWRLQTKYGRNYPEDCKRRVRNVEIVCNKAGV